MEIKNNEGKNVEVHLKEKWYASIERTPVAWVIAFLIFVVAPLFLMISTIGEAEPAGRESSHEATAIISVICILFFLLLNIPLIKRIFKPAEYVVEANNGTLTITRNGEEKLTITSQNTNKIVLNRHRRETIGMVIFLEEPDLNSQREGHPINLSFIPKEEKQEFLNLLVSFYGEER